MSVSPALTGGEVTALAGPSTILRYLSPIVDTVVATAMVNQVTFNWPITALTVDGTSAGWGNIREGMTVYVGSTSGGADRGIYRVRKAGNSTTIYVQELGSQDAGQLAVDLRTASVSNDDYITVVERFDLWAVSPKIDADTAAIYEDTELTVGSHNTTPENMVNITVNGRRNHLFDLITGSALAITAVATAIKWPTSAGSSVTHTWTVPGAWTGVSGTSSATLTANVPPGNYTLYYTQHDSIGGDTQRVIHVNVHHPTLNPPVLISTQPKSDSRDRIGRRMSFDLYDDRLTELVNGGMIGYFEVCTWNGGDVPTATKQFVGWVQRETHEGTNGLRQATLEIIGPAALLGMMGGTSQIIESAASPTNWQQCVPSLASASFMVWYMLRWRAANVLRLFDLTVFSTDPTGQRKPQWIIDKGSLLQQMQSLATDRGNFGCNSEGAMFFLRHPSLINYADRGGVVQRDTLTPSLYSKVVVQVERQRKVQQVRGEAFAWDGSAALPTPLYADSPKVVAQGSTQTKLASQVVSSQAEIEQLTGDEENRQNNKYPQIDAQIQRNRDVYEPAEMAFVTITIPDTLSPTGVTWSERCIPLSVNKTHNADGTSDINLSLEGETHNLKGDYVPVPDGNDTVYIPPYAPDPVDPLPPPALGDFGILAPAAVLPTSPLSSAPSVVPGRAAIRNTNANAYCTYDIRPSAPDWVARNVPAWFTTISMMVHDAGTPFSRGAYLLGNDGTNSRVAYTEDVYETAPVWTLGTTITGIFNMVESVKDKPGEIIIKGNVTSVGGGPSAWAVVYKGTEIGRGVESVGGYPYIDVQAEYHGPAGGYITYLSTGDNSVCCDLHDVGIVSGSQDLGGVSWALCGEALFGLDETPPHSSGFISSANGFSVCEIRLASTSPITYRVRFEPACATVFASETLYSSDFGSTFGTPQSITYTGSSSGMSVGQLGISIIVGNGAKASITNDHDGVGYRDANNGGAAGTYPISLLVPTYRINSTSLTNRGINPNYLMAFPALVSGDSLVKVTGVGRSGISPSISGTKALGVSPHGLDSWRGKRFFFIGDVSGTRYLFMTKNTGVSWSYTAMAGAVSVRARRFSSNGYEAIAAAGTNDLKYTANGGSSWSTKTASGNNLYAELFG